MSYTIECLIRMHRDSVSVMPVYVRDFPPRLLRFTIPTNVRAQAHNFCIYSLMHIDKIVEEYQS